MKQMSVHMHITSHAHEEHCIMLKPRQGIDASPKSGHEGLKMLCWRKRILTASMAFESAVDWPWPGASVYIDPIVSDIAGRCAGPPACTGEVVR